MARGMQVAKSEKSVRVKALTGASPEEVAIAIENCCVSNRLARRVAKSKKGRQKK